MICPTDKIWDSIFSEHSFLKKVAKLIQSTVENETKKLFKADTWANVSSIDLDSGYVSAVGQETDILNIFKDYFSEKRINELYLKVKKTLFSTTSNSIVILFEKEILKGMLTADGYKRFDKSAFDQLKEMFSEVLAKDELNRFVLRFRNLMLWGCDYDGFPILEVKNKNSGGKDVYVDYNGLRLVCDPSYYCIAYYTDNVSLETLEAIAKIVRSHLKNGRIKLEDEDDIIVQGLSFSYCVVRSGRALVLFNRESDAHLEFAMVSDGNLIFDFDSYKNKHLRVNLKK